MSQQLIEAFNVRENDLIAIVGGGGKSSLLFALERSWPQPVVVTTTTRIFAAQIAQARAHLTLDKIDLLDEHLARHGSCLVIGETHGDKAHGVPIEWPAQLLTRPSVNLVVVEADGSRMRPVKAPAAHEPVVPPETTLGVIVVGMDALERPISETAHRPELVCQLTGLRPDQTLTPSTLAQLLAHPAGGMKNMPPSAQIAVCLNKCETEERQNKAKQVATHLLTYSSIDRVILTTLQPEVMIYEVVT
ncbi:MAG: selenium cofactor biosynthesis protein YqeC [Chloroflexota bacterium]